ncbi:MAG: EthD domain-containing protein [Actinomycetes bacterium]
MLKVLWFLKRAEGLTLAEFSAWWEEHLHMIAERQQPQLVRYTVNIKASDDDTLAGKPVDDCEWDGVAEQWFVDEDAFNEVYGRPTASETRQDTLNHVSRFERIIVREIEVIP